MDTCLDNCIDVRSVLGDSRRAPLHDGDGWPWYTCPWCSAPVYVQGAHPDHALLSTISVGGICSTYGCLANPGVQIADAQRIVTREQERQADAARREDERHAAIARIQIEQRAREDAWTQIRTDAESIGACLTCAYHAFRIGAPPRLIRHRRACPRTSRPRT